MKRTMLTETDSVNVSVTDSTHDLMAESVNQQLNQTQPAIRTPLPSQVPYQNLQILEKTPSSKGGPCCH